MKDKQFKVLVILNVMTILLLLVICIFLLSNGNGSNKTEKIDNDTTTSESSDYDVSMMKTVNLKEVVDLFDSKKQYVLYIGRSTCSSCKKFLPSLQKAQEELDYTTQYLDVTTIDGDSTEMQQLIKLLDIETTVTVTDNDGNPKDVTDTYGNLLDRYGFTPMVIIIDNGKMVAGNIGSMDYDEFISLLEENGVN